MLIEDAIWICVGLLIAATIAIIWLGRSETPADARTKFYDTLSESDRESLHAHELLGGSWRSFRRQIEAEAGPEN
jgi:5-bromo-4-chloroindolyl phosphate hydrolysis protein